MKKSPKIAVSACLTGICCRYNGVAKPNATVIADAATTNFIPICPECEAGLPTPRPPMNLIQSADGIHLKSSDGGDPTDRLAVYGQKLLTAIRNREFDGFLCKSRSPSCAQSDAPILDESGQTIGYGAGYVIRLIQTTFPNFPIIDENQWQNSSLKEVFLEKIR